MPPTRPPFLLLVVGDRNENATVPDIRGKPIDEVAQDASLVHMNQRLTTTREMPARRRLLAAQNNSTVSRFAKD